MLIKIIHVDMAKAGSGRNQYDIAEVTYESNGAKRAFKVFSFANPQVFKVVSNAKAGDSFDVVVGKNDKGYDAWNSIEPVTGGVAPSNTPNRSDPPKFAGDRESKDEREAKQRYIIRQSSLSNAIAVLTAGAKAPPKTSEVFQLAEDLVKFVYESAPSEQEAVDLFLSPNDIP